MLANNFIGLPNQGSMKVDDQSKTMPYTVIKYYGSSVKLEAVWHSINSIEYSFDHWQDASTSNPRTISSLTSDMSFTAYFRGKPTNNGEFVHFGPSVGQPIVVLWTDNPNTNVTQYQIWRRVKHNGVMGPETLIATVNRGVQTYTDYDYLLISSYTHDLLYYDVRAYYSTEGTYSDPNYVAVYGMEYSIISEDDFAMKSIENELPREYSISNYPNPFNPTTRISYSLPEASYVTLKVFDILGSEIVTLVNGAKPSGKYEVEFDASQLPSGTYIYKLTAGNYQTIRKMLLIK